MGTQLVVGGGTVLTMVPGQPPIGDGAVAMEGERIVAVGPADEVVPRYPRALRLDAGGGLIVPGLVNTHTHLAMTLLRGAADDLPLREWLEQHIWPAERTLMDAETVALGTRLAAAESLLAGVTCVFDMYFHAETVAEVAREVGLRAVVAEGLLDYPTPSAPTPADALATQRRLLERYQDHPLVTPAVAPHAPYSVAADLLVAEAELAEEFDAPLAIHVAETRWEVEAICKEKGRSPVRYLADLGILSERTVAAHCVHVSNEDLDILAEFGVGIASNPVSNLKLGSGVAPLPEMLARGLKVSLGTDGAASNNTLDLLRDAQLAALLYKGLTGDPTCLPARTVVELVTIGGARVLGLADRLGTLEAGKLADLVSLRIDSPHSLPLWDPLAHLAYAARAADVQHVVVGGQVVVRDGALTTVDLAALRREVDSAMARLQPVLRA